MHIVQSAAVLVDLSQTTFSPLVLFDLQSAPQTIQSPVQQPYCDQWRPLLFRGAFSNWIHLTSCSFQCLGASAVDGVKVQLF